MISDDFDVTINALLRGGKTRILFYHFSFGLKSSEHLYPALAVEDNYCRTIKGSHFFLQVIDIRQNTTYSQMLWKCVKWGGHYGYCQYKTLISMVTFTSLGEDDWADLSTSSPLVFPTSAPVSPLAVTSSHLRSSQLHVNSCKGIRLNFTLGKTFNKRPTFVPPLLPCGWFADDLEKMGLSFFLSFHIAYTKELSDRNELF